MEVLTEDMNLSEQVFGLDVPNTKGKWTKEKPKIVSNEDVVEIPPELDLALSTICVIIRAGTSCPMMFGNNLFNIKTFDQNGHIGSAYPEF